MVFTKWVMNVILSWENKTKVKNLIKISGTKDKLMPPRAGSEMLIEGGAHFMIVDRAEEVSDVVNGLIHKLTQ